MVVGEEPSCLVKEIKNLLYEKGALITRNDWNYIRIHSLYD